MSRKIVRIDGAPVSVDYLLGAFLENVKNGDISAVYIGYKTEDGSYGASWSVQTSLDLVAHAKIADDVASRIFLDDR